MAANQEWTESNSVRHFKMLNLFLFNIRTKLKLSKCFTKP